MTDIRHVQRYLQWRLYKLKRRLVRTVCRRLYQDRNRDTSHSFLIAGTGRSGTTWLADIVASQLPCRIMFEPFYSKLVNDFSQFHYFHYMRPSDQDNDLLAYCKKILSGDIKHAWIDSQVDRIFSEYRLIKAIRANLFLKWLHNNFNETPLLFIIRHPCGVVLSRMQLNWATDTDIEPFLAQPEFMRDFLTDKLDIISGAKTVEEKHAVIWCISNLVPLTQFLPGELPIIFYENLCCQPEVEVPKVFAALGQPYHESIFSDLTKPSATTLRTSAILTDQDRIAHWKTELSPKQINNILSIVKSFALDYLYGDSTQPLVEL